MKNIKINGLSSSHIVMLDTMWSLKSVEEFNDWVSSLLPSQRKTARVLRELLQVELLDIDLDRDPDFTEANEVIDRFR